MMWPLPFVQRLAPLALLFSLACPLRGLPADVPSSPSPMPEAIGQYEADQSSTTRAFELPASAESLDRLQRLLSAWRAKLRGLDFPKLDPAGKVDYLLLANELDRSLAHVSRDRRRLAEMEPLLAFRQTILTLESARRQGGPLDVRDAATKIDQLGRDVKQLRERVEKDHKASGDAKPTGTPKAVGRDKPVGWDKLAQASAGPPTPPSPGGPAAATAALSHPTRSIPRSARDWDLPRTARDFPRSTSAGPARGRSGRN